MAVYTLEQRFAMWACDRFTEDADFCKKNHIFKQAFVAFGVQKTLIQKLINRHTRNESLFGADFGPES